MAGKERIQAEINETGYIHQIRQQSQKLTF